MHPSTETKRRSEHHWTLASQIRHGEAALGSGFDGEDIEAAECLQYLIKHDYRTIVRHNGRIMMKCDRNMVNTQSLGSTSIDEDVHRPSIWGKKVTRGLRLLQSNSCLSVEQFDLQVLKAFDLNLPTVSICILLYGLVIHIFLRVFGIYIYVLYDTVYLWIMRF